MSTFFADEMFWIGVALGLAPLIVAMAAVRFAALRVPEGACALVSRFGKHARTIEVPGLTWMPSRILPWTDVHLVSMQRDFRHYTEIHVNDRQGMTVVVDLWLELRVVDAERSLYKVEDWEASLRSVLIHAATSLLGARAFEQILHNRTELAALVRDEIRTETARWGLDVEMVYISRLSLQPAVAQQMLKAVATRLEREMLHIEEGGRQSAALVHAETTAEIATLRAEAKSRYAVAVGRAYQHLGKNRELLAAYGELYELSLLRPERTVTLAGFTGENDKLAETVLAMPGIVGGATARSLETTMGEEL